MLRFRCRRKRERGVYTHFVVVVRIVLWRSEIIFVGLQRR